ncbi:MAG: hypothetical protein ACLUIO_00390 [Neglectibacter timonensis]
MKKKLFALAVAFVLMVLLCACKENQVVEKKTVSIQQEIVYAYVTTEMLTNGYGGVHGHQDYICYGVQDGDNILDKEDRMDCVTMRKSEKGHSYIEYYYDRKIYEDGTHYDIYAGAALYLTDDMLKNLRTIN